MGAALATTHLSVQREREQRVSGGDQDVLMAVEHVGFGRVRDLAQMGVPEDLPVRRVVRHQIAAEDRRQTAVCPAVVSMPLPTPPPPIPGIAVPPGDLAGLVVDRRQIAPQRRRALSSSLPPSPIAPRGSVSVR